MARAPAKKKAAPRAKKAAPPPPPAKKALAPTAKRRVDSAQNRELAQHRADIDRIFKIIGTIAGTAALDQILIKGYEEIAAPLRELTPRRVGLGKADASKLSDLQKSLERPNWDEFV